MLALEHLIYKYKIKEENILLVSIITVPETVIRMNRRFPGITFITAALGKDIYLIDIFLFVCV